MLIDFNAQQERKAPGMNGGTGEMSAKIFMDQEGKIIPYRIHPGGSIGMHSHPASDDINYIISGRGKAVCAWSLVWDDSPLFEEDFQAWANGPVCPELFFKTQGKYSAGANDETGGEGDLSDNQRDTIDRVLEHYGSHDAQWLSQLTHMEDPWIKARAGVPSGAGCNNVITKESMALYYGGL